MSDCENESDFGYFFPSYFLRTSTEEYAISQQNQPPPSLPHERQPHVSHEPMYQTSGKEQHTEETRTSTEMSAIEHQVASGCMDVSSGSFHHLTAGAHANIDEFTSSSFPQEEQKKQNHSEIEKRRREKMNSCIRELASIIPVCSGMSRKLDKLTVLRMAVQHLKTIKGSLSAFMPGSQARPAFLSERKIHELILQVAEGFLFVVSCDRGKILFVSESVCEVLNYSREELLGQNWFDILHPKDVAKVKEQLTSNDLMKKKERFVDAKTLLPLESDFRSGSGGTTAADASASQSHGLSAFSPGARRSFFCRMKCKSLPKGKEEADTTTGISQKKRKNTSEKKYNVIYCMGYIKSWSSTAATRSPTSAGMSNESAEESEDSGCNLSCLVAAARTLPPFTPPTATASTIPTEAMEFVSRHSMDGKFLFVDQRAVFIMGFLPQELLGTSNYEYCHPDDVQFLADAHRRALASTTEVNSGAYRFKNKSGSYLYMQTTWKTFKNPWTKDFEFLVARNTCVPAPESDVVVESSNFGSVQAQSMSCHLSPLDQMIKKISKSGPSCGSNENSSGSSSETRVRKLLSSSRVNLWKIGKQIAEEAIDQQKKYENESIGSISSRSNISSNVSSPCLSNEASGGENLCAKNSGCGGSRSGGTSDPGSHNSEGSSANSIYSTNFFANQLEQDQSSDLSIPGTSQQVSQPIHRNPSTGIPDLSLHPPDQVHYLTHAHTNDPLLVSAAVSDPTDSLSVNASALSGIPTQQPTDQVPASAATGPEPGPGDMDEAAMALVMSLLEADAGLGGPVDFSGLPWPLF